VVTQHRASPSSLVVPPGKTPDVIVTGLQVENDAAAKATPRRVIGDTSCVIDVVTRISRYPAGAACIVWIARIVGTVELIGLATSVQLAHTRDIGISISADWSIGA